MEEDGERVKPLKEIRNQKAECKMANPDSKVASVENAIEDKFLF
jgi:hypothetical protein